MSKVKAKSTVRKLVTVPRLVIFCLLILVLIMGAWAYLRNTMVKGLIDGIATLESQDYEIGHGGLSIGGFPFFVNATTRDATLRAPISETPDPTKNWSIKSDSLRMHSAVLTPLSWNVEHRGQMRIDMHGQNGERYTFDVTPTTVDTRVVFSLAGTLKSARIDIAHAQLDSLVGTPPIISQFDQVSANIQVLNNIGHVSMSGTELRLSPKIPAMLNNIMGRKLALIKLDVNIDNWALLEDEGTGPWIAANSRIRSEHWAVQWGSADMIGDFDIIFKNGLPEGIIQVRLKKPEPLLQKLIDNKLISGKYAGTAKLLVAMQKTQSDDRKSIKITIKEGVVKAGLIPIHKF